MSRRAYVFLFAAIIALAFAPAARGQTQASGEWLCDSSTTNCRTPLLTLINNENIGIDVAFWFMEDSRYSTAIIDRHRAGVPVRVLIDTKANSPYPGNVPILNALRDAGIPMRRMTSSYLHWKFMVFAGQNRVQFGSANYSPHAFVYEERLVDFIDEAIYFSNDADVVNSFKTKFDDAWVSTSRFTNYANVTGTLTRSYPVYPIDPELSFPTTSDFGSRSVGRYNAETASTGGIDSIIYRITDRRHTDAVIAAHQRGVPVRIITEPSQYRDQQRYMHSYNVDRLYAAGIPIRHRRHQGSNHQKTTLLHGQNMAIFGSQNWTTISGNAQYEHNYFTTKSWIYTWFTNQFNRKWNSSTETEPFVPLPPSTPQIRQPAPGSAVEGTQVTLRWWAGLWPHKYDIYFGTSSNPPRIATDVELGNSTSQSDLISYTVTGLTQDRTYYWRVVSKTMANMTRSTVVSNFTTNGTGTTPPPPLPVPWTSRDIGSVGPAGSASLSNGTFTVRGGGADVWGTGNDAFHYAYQPLSGDGSIVARVASISGTQAWTKVGVMIRSSTATNAAYAFMIVSQGKGLAYQRRTATGASAINSGRSGTAPQWVRLVRSGSTITASVSTNGTSWSTVGSSTFTMSSSALIGLVSHSHTTSALATATFDNVTVVP
jgi:regulation of enolase protein 1 (concanavalin A-like superfamily)